MKFAITMMYVGFWIDSREDIRGYSALSWVWDTEAVTEVPVRAEVPTGCRLSGYLQSTVTAGKQRGPLTVVKQYVSYSLKYEALVDNKLIYCLFHHISDSKFHLWFHCWNL